MLDTRHCCHCSERARLDRIAERRACAVRLQETNLAHIDGGISKHSELHPLLRLPIGRSQAG